MHGCHNMMNELPLGPGTWIDRYKITRRLAVGGMAEIYLADATGLGGFEKTVALKRILGRYALHPEFVTMFLDEARVAGRLHHPHIAQVYDIVSDGANYFIAMEYVDGRDLRHVRRANATLGEQLPLEYAVAITLGVAAGLHAAHEARCASGQPLHVVHRDVSPANILVTDDGSVKVIDFGIAKAEGRQTTTRTGTRKGKSQYMSPEQCLGATVDRRSDVFALGILLYELTTGVQLFAAESEHESMRRIVRAEFPTPRERRTYYPSSLEHIVMKALALDPEERYDTAQDFYSDLEAFAHSERLSTGPYRLGQYIQDLFEREQAADAELQRQFDRAETIEDGERASTRRDEPTGTIEVDDYIVEIDHATALTPSHSLVFEVDVDDFDEPTGKRRVPQLTVTARCLRKISLARKSAIPWTRQAIVDTVLALDPRRVNNRTLGIVGVFAFALLLALATPDEPMAYQPPAVEREELVVKQKQCEERLGKRPQALLVADEQWPDLSPTPCPGLGPAPNH